MGIAGRVREARRAAGMTQVDLAAGRFTKQYVSQIERGEVVPSGDLLDWLAERLGVERLYLETGLRASALQRIEERLAEGQDLLHARRDAEAFDLFHDVRQSLTPDAARSTHRSAMRGETWALIRLGRLGEAAELLVEEGSSTASPTLEERAEVAYLTAVCCYTLSTIPAAHAEFARALELLDEADEPNDRLRSDIHQWRSRCYRRQRDYEAAQEDIDRALELVDALGDDRRRAEVSLQASLVAERKGRFVLARRYAEIARDLYEIVGDDVTRGRAINNAAAYNHGLGNDEAAIAQLREAFEIFVDAHLQVEAGYVLSSLAEIHRERGDLDEAEIVARRALSLLEGRTDHVQELGTAQLVLARTHLGQGELDEAEEMLGSVDEIYALADSVSHQARSWMARGELELVRRNESEAARLYREAATALQPIDLETP
jgi:tetratricopeptide (TPR) repeat protein